MTLRYAFAYKNLLVQATPQMHREWRGSLDAPRKLYSVRKRSDSNKAPGRNGNQPYVMGATFFLL